MLDSDFSRHTMPKIVLASASPRRRDLLSTLLFEFEVRPSAIVEEPFPGGDPEEHVRTIAQAKTREVARTSGDALVIGADTVVVVDTEVLGKPGGPEEARGMLSRLSGRWHCVLTGLCLMSGLERAVVSCESTRVKFALITPSEIEWYIQTGEPLDKAGAYAIQGHGGLFIERIEGDYFNVVGLPLRLLYCMAEKLGTDLKSLASPERSSGRGRSVR